MIKILTLMGLLWPAMALGGDLKPFTTDACSVFPEGTAQQQSLWSHCCVRHDIAYWQGGTYDERLQADQDLEQCVSGVGEPEIAKLMLAGVRAGGSPYFPTSYRWGYGWSFPRGYDPLTAAEKAEIAKSLSTLEMLIQHILQELQQPPSQ